VDDASGRRWIVETRAAAVDDDPWNLGGANRLFSFCAVHYARFSGTICPLIVAPHARFNWPSSAHCIFVAAHGPASSSHASL